MTYWLRAANATALVPEDRVPSRDFSWLPDLPLLAASASERYVPAMTSRSCWTFGGVSFPRAVKLASSCCSNGTDRLGLASCSFLWAGVSVEDFLIAMKSGQK